MNMRKREESGRGERRRMANDKKGGMDKGRKEEENGRKRGEGEGEEGGRNL